MTLAERIRLAARLRDLRDGELAAMAGLSASGLSKILNGKVVPRFDTVEALVDALGMGLGEFFSLGETITPGRALMLLKERTDLSDAAPGDYPRLLTEADLSDEVLTRAIRIALKIVREESAAPE